MQNFSVKTVSLTLGGGGQNDNDIEKLTKIAWKHVCVAHHPPSIGFPGLQFSARQEAGVAEAEAERSEGEVLAEGEDVWQCLEARAVRLAFAGPFRLFFEEIKKQVNSIILPKKEEGRQETSILKKNTLKKEEMSESQKKKQN